MRKMVYTSFTLCHFSRTRKIMIWVYCRGSESKPMKPNEAKLSDKEVHGYYRNILSLPEKDPDIHTCLFYQTLKTVGAVGQMCLDMPNRYT